jgi:hypothetical protein
VSLGLCCATFYISLDDLNIGDHLTAVLKAKLRDISVILCWGVLIASITLQGLYQRLYLTAWDIALLFLASVIAGIVLVDAVVIVVGYMASFVISMIVIFVCITLPATLGKLMHALLGEILYQEALILMVRTFIPLPVVLCFLGGLTGGIIGEALKLR